MREYRVECEHCDNVSTVLTQYTVDEPMFCPMCGRRTEPEEIDEEDDYDDT